VPEEINYRDGETCREISWVSNSLT